MSLYIKRLMIFVVIYFSSANYLSTYPHKKNKGPSCPSGQFFILTLPSFQTFKEFGTWLEKTQPAGVMLIPAHVKNRLQTKKLCSFLQLKVKKLGIFPLLICIDWEGGIVSRPTESGGFTSIPSPYNLAKSGKSDCFLAAQLVAQQMSDVGINVDFAPSLDLFDPKNPILATRCFGATPEIVSDCGIAFCKGLMSYGIMPVIKHYPGLMLGKGDTHFDKIEINATQEEFDHNEKPFIAALREKLPIIMIGHAQYKQFGPIPASRSGKVIKRLKQYNANLIAVTDDIAMQAYNNGQDLSNTVIESINNGFDLVIYSAPPEKQIQLIEKINRQINSKKNYPNVIKNNLIKLKQNLIKAKKIILNLDEKEVASQLAKKALYQKINSIDFSDKNTVLISVDYTKIRPAEILIDSEESNNSGKQTQFAALLKKAQTNLSAINFGEFILDPKSDQSCKKLEEFIESGTPNSADYIFVQTFFYGDGIWNKIQTQWLEMLEPYANKIIVLSLGHPSEKFILPQSQIIELGSFNIPMLNAAVRRLTTKPLLTGADKLAQNPKAFLENKKFGILCHKCSVVNLDNKTEQNIVAQTFATQYFATFLPDFLYNWAQNSEYNSKLCALFAPEHGIMGTQQDGAQIKSENSSKWDCPVYSLHGATKCPTPEMLKDLDLLIIDFQEAGVRCYTYLSTLALTLQAAKDCNIPVLLLERPNPIKFLGAFGPNLNPEFESFLGKVPTQFGHGSTIGEIAENLNAKIGADLTVLKCDATSFYKINAPNVPARGECFLQAAPFDTPRIARHSGRAAKKNVSNHAGIKLTSNGTTPESLESVDAYFSSNFIPPSPNLPTIDSVYVYPMTVFIEGTNYSEGRGTAYPFEQIGAPWVNAKKLAANLNNKKLPGIYFEPISFTPKIIPGKAETPKHKNSLCHGVFLHIYNRKKIKPFLTTQTILKELFQAHPKQSEWIKSGNRYFIDLLAGDDSMRKIAKG
ncbi:MAG: exo-beta-N-acetylmuramidase NamZ domain-containing protein [Candidatus Babeliales bacterium]